MSNNQITFNGTGPVALTSSELREKVVKYAKSVSPGFTDDLPGSLVEDIVSTAVGALLTCDAARVEVLNSIGPRTGNEFMLNDLAAQYGIPARQGEGLTTVNIEFSGPPGFNIPKGFIVSDGTHQYSIRKDNIIPDSGTTKLITAYGTVSGVWDIPANTVKNLVTSVPKEITLTVNNPSTGIPGSDAETVFDFRSRVWDAGMATVYAIPKTIRTALAAVENVNPRLVSVVQSGKSFIVMCGGGDVYEMAGAIFNSAGDFTKLEGLDLEIEMLTTGTVTTIKTTYTHGFSDGQQVQLTGVNSIPGLAGNTYTATILNPWTFTIPYDSSSDTWDETGDVLPNFRDQLVAINDWPDEYEIPFIIPLEQVVEIEYQWRTDGNNYLSSETISALVTDPTIQYINDLYAGNPININTLKNTFLEALNETINRDKFTYLRVIVTVNGIITDPDPSTDIISGDRYSYWFANSSAVTVKAAT